MIFCGNCKTENTDGSEFCVNCGMSVSSSYKRIKALDVMDMQTVVEMDETPEIRHYSAGYSKGFKDGFAMRPEIYQEAQFQDTEHMNSSFSLWSRIGMSLSGNNAVYNQLKQNSSLIYEGLFFTLMTFIINAAVIHNMSVWFKYLGILIVMAPDFFSLLGFMFIIIVPVKIMNKTVNARSLIGLLLYSFAVVEAAKLLFLFSLPIAGPSTMIHVLMLSLAFVAMVYSVFINSILVQKTSGKSFPLIFLIVLIATLFAAVSWLAIVPYIIFF